MWLPTAATEQRDEFFKNSISDTLSEEPWDDFLMLRHES